MDIWVPQKRNIIRPERIITPPKTLLAGRFKIDVRKADGRWDTERHQWQDNLITDAGMDQFGSGGKVYFQRNLYSWIAQMSVGTGNTAPAVTDTVLDTRIAFKGFDGTWTYGHVNDVLPYYRWWKLTYTFNQGEAVGDWAELGVGMHPSYGSLSTRALIVDSEGDPTTITVAADEQVQVTYEFRSYNPTATPVVSTMTINSVLYDTELMIAQSDTDKSAIVYGGKVDRAQPYSGATVNQGAHDGVPAGAMNVMSPVMASYTPGSHYIDGTTVVPYTSNYWAANGWTAFLLESFTDIWQMSFTQNILTTKGIPHNNTTETTVNYRHSWDRYTPP